MSETFFGLTVFDVRGNPNLSRMHSTRITRPGVHGQAYKLIGIRGKESALQVISMHSSFAAAAAFEVSLEALTSTMGGFTQAGTTYVNYFLLDTSRISRIREDGVGGAPSSTSAFTVRYSCLLEYAGL